ncbi:MAG: hypothetical protein KKD18_02660 [Nanoarchaeota archaeon]|nr:hypothetical protein [Nanoarchaeota archaeon]
MLERLPEEVKENPKRFVVVPQTNLIISPYGYFVGRRYNLIEALQNLRDMGLEGSTIAEFMCYRTNLRKAANDKIQLFYSDGTSVSRDQTVDMWDYISLKNRSKFEDRPCATWLNGQFVKGSGFLELDLITRRLQNGTLVNQRESLLEMCPEGWYVNVGSLNEQGLGTKKFTGHRYVKDRNFFQIPPCENGAAWFEMDSNGADLECVANPEGSDIWRGIFATVRLTN